MAGCVTAIIVAVRAAQYQQEAEQAHQQADANGRQLDDALAKARARAERAAANTHVLWGQAAWDADNPALAQHHLDSVPENLRFWEWHYLKGRFSSGGLVIFRAPKNEVVSVIFSPDGQRLATVGADIVKVWDITTGKELLTLRGGDVAWSPDGQRIATARSERKTRTINVWDAQSGKKLLSMPGPGSGPESSYWGLAFLSFSGNGKYLAASSEGDVYDKPPTPMRGGVAEGWLGPGPGGPRAPGIAAVHDRAGQVKIWQTATGKELYDFSGHSVAFSPDSQRIAHATRDGSVIVRNLEPPGEPKLLKGHGQVVTHVVFNPNGQLIATASYDKTAKVSNVKICDAKTGNERLSLPEHVNTIHKLAFSPDGSKLVTVTPSRFDWADRSAGRVRVWETITGRELANSSGHEAVFSPDGQLLAFCNNDHTLRVRNLATGEGILIHKGHTQHISALAFSPDGNRIASASYDGTVRIWSAKPERETSPIKEHHGPTLRTKVEAAHPFAMSPDGQFVATTVAQDTLNVGESRTGKEVFTFQGKDRIGSVAFSRDGKMLAIAVRGGPVEIWDFATNEKIAIVEEATDASSVAFSPDGLRVASPIVPGVGLWDWFGTKLAELGEQTWVTSVAFSPDGQRLASGANSVILWDLPSKKAVFTVKWPHFACVHSLAFSPDGALLAGGNTDCNVQLWDAKSGTELWSLKGHAHFVSSVAFNPDGQRLASASLDKTVKLWDPHTGQELITLHGHTSAALSVAFSTDGKRLISAGFDRKVRVWEIP